MKFDGKAYLDMHLESMNIDHVHFIDTFEKLFNSEECNVPYRSIQHKKEKNYDYLLIHPKCTGEIQIDEIEIGNRRLDRKISSSNTIYISGHFKSYLSDFYKVKCLIGIEYGKNQFSLSVVINDSSLEKEKNGGIYYYNSDNEVEYYDNETLALIREFRSDNEVGELISYSPDKLNKIGFLPDCSKKMNMTHYSNGKFYSEYEYLVESLLKGSRDKFVSYLKNYGFYNGLDRGQVKNKSKQNPF